jgi:ankyrin repeat protein
VNVALPGDSSTLIHVAARNQQNETVKLLLQLGASIDCQDGSGKMPLHVSVETGTLYIIKCLVEHQESVRRETEWQHVASPERTVNRGEYLNVHDIDGNTPLYLGAAAGNFDIIFYLVSAGSDLNTCNVQGDYLLTPSARFGKNDIVELLLKTKVMFHEAKIGTLRAPINAGHVHTTALLLSLGIPVNIRENEQPIYVASRLGREEIVTLLLQYGASLTSHTDTGNTSLHLASEAGHLNLVKCLVEVERSFFFC